MSERILIYGAGELGGRVGALAVADGHDVLGFTASTERHDHLRAQGIIPRTGSPANVLTPDDRLLFSLAGHETQGEAVSRLTHLSPPRRAVLISTVGVYGSDASGRIDETTLPADEERAQSILSVENQFMDWVGDAGVVLRCAGLYSDDRGPIHALARRGYPRPGPPDKGLALIHYDDAARAAFEALIQPKPEPLYNLVTPPVPTREEFYTAACAALNLPAPTFTDPIGDPPADYDVSRLRRDLLEEVRFPDWRAAAQLFRSA